MSDGLLEKQIGATERRLEMRRERVARHVEEARAEADSRLRTGLKWAPLIAVGTVGVLAFRAGRQGPVGSGTAQSSANGGIRSAASVAPKANGASSFATLATVAGVVARAALNPQARELWRLYVSRPKH